MIISGLHELATLLLDESFFENFCMANVVVAVIFFFVSFRHPIRYGRLGRNVAPKMKLTIRSGWAFFIFNIIPLLLYAYIVQDYAESYRSQGVTVFTVENITWAIFRLFRGVIYAMKRSKFADPWPLESVLFNLILNLDLAAIGARSAMVDLIEFFSARCFISLAFWIVAFVMGAYYDFRASKNRYKASCGYKIIKGGLFNYVTSPNLLCELILWISWCTMLNFEIGTITILIWRAALLIGRAELYQKWSKKHLHGYPENRKAIIPFINLGDLVNAVVSCLQYGF